MFTYAIPKEFLEQIFIGSRVIVQFGKKKILTGIVGKVHANPPSAYEAKPILDVLDEQPSVNPMQIQFWSWMADYYCCDLGEVMHAALPAGLRLSSESRIQLNPEFDPESSQYPIDPREDKILEALENAGEISYADCEVILETKNILPIVKSLVTKEAILVFEKIQEKYSPKKVSKIRIHKKILEENGKLQKVFDSLGKSPKQESILLKYLREVPVMNQPERNILGIEKSKLLSDGDSPSSLKTLIKNGVLESFEEIVNRIDSIEATRESVELSAEQKRALSEIKNHFEDRQTVLLQGITGSGKTEIYVKLIQEAIDSGSQALLLLPEIALTTQIVSRLKQVFGYRMGVYHSKYSDNERVEVWNGVIQGRFPFVVGVRSSLFLPFDSLGVIIVDEEHEASYKQFDPAPRFQARDSAIMLCYFHQAKTILGSATPSFESYSNARTGKYGHVILDQRYKDAKLPDFHLSSLSEDKRKNLLKLDTTRLLREKIQQALDSNQQVLIFQNRRGYSPYIQCESCGWTGQCIQCDVSLTYHQFTSELRCHYCGYKEEVPTACPQCGSGDLKTMGMGTEQIEESLSLLFPEARIGRMDLDTTRSKHGYQRILDEFGHGHLDILVGTQMISKGLDFERVTVVGIWDGDRILNFPDFRSGERAFQQITQVAGRAGRGNAKGDVIIQSRKPDQYIYDQIIKGDFDEFYLQEMHDRKQFFYPPYVKLIKITARHQDYKTAEQGAIFLHNKMSQIDAKKILLGPEKALIGKIKNQYQFETLIKLDRSGAIQNHFKKELRQIIDQIKIDSPYKSVRYVIDVDPN